MCISKHFQFLLELCTIVKEYQKSPALKGSNAFTIYYFEISSIYIKGQVDVRMKPPQIVWLVLFYVPVDQEYVILGIFIFIPKILLIILGTFFE